MNDMKHEINVSELTPPPNFSLILLKREKLAKSWTLTPETKNNVLLGDQWWRYQFIMVLKTIFDVIARYQILF